MDHKSDALRHGKPTIAQGTVRYQVISEHQPVGAHRDRRPPPGLADDPVGFLGVSGAFFIGDGRRCGVKNAGCVRVDGHGVDYPAEAARGHRPDGLIRHARNA